MSVLPVALAGSFRVNPNELKQIHHHHESRCIFHLRQFSCGNVQSEYRRKIEIS